MNKKPLRRNIETPQLNKILSGLNKLQQTVLFEQSLCAHQNCACLVCQQKKGQVKQKIISYYNHNSQNSDIWLLKILSGLYSRDVPTLKLYIPDICFLDGDILKVFHTDSRDNRLKKIQGTTPTKLIYFTMLRLKKQYKQMLQQKFQKNILNQIHPQFIHQKYIEHILPSYFNDGDDNNRLNGNKQKFMSYILHKDKAMLIQSIEQHKINQNQPFCSLRFKDGNSQLLSKKQFQNYTALGKISSDISYVQSYIKEKQQQKANFTSCYSFQSKQTKIDLFNRAEKYVLILIGGIGKYSQLYQDVQNIQDSIGQLMKQDVDTYILYVTYQIVHYLGMVSRIYVKHIKINWVLNDLDMIYLQSVFQFQTTEVCLRHLKYRLPPKQQNIVFYKDSENFISLYKQIQALREAKRLKIRSKIQTQKDLLFQTLQKTENSTSIENTQNSLKLEQVRNLRRQSLKLKKPSKTISLATNGKLQSISQNKSKSKFNLEQQQKQKQTKMPKIDKNKKIRIRYMSVLDKYAI